MRRRLMPFAALILAGLVGAACTPVNQTALTADAADPDIAWDGHVYVLHTTNTGFGNVPTFTSTDLTNWTFVGDALSVLPAWADSGFTWAPSAIRRGDGKWFLYFSAAVRGQRTRNGQPLKCLGVAAGPTAAGPYTVVKELNTAPLLCEPSGGGTIDPSPFMQSPTSFPYLVSKVDGNSSALPTRIENRRMNPSLWSFAPLPPSTLLASTIGTWEKQVIEGPDLLMAGGRLHLIYSGGDFATTTYGEGQALCAATSQACGRNGRLLQGPAYGAGAGGASEFRDARGVSRIAWHFYPDGKTNGPRLLAIGQTTVTSAGVLGIANPPSASALATRQAPEQRIAGGTSVSLTVPAGTPITVPNAHTR